MNSGTGVRAGQPSVSGMARLWNRISVGVSCAAILLYLLFRYSLHLTAAAQSFPLWLAIVCGGVPLLYDLFRQAVHREFGSDFLAGLSIVTSAVMGELLVATIIVLMLSGGQALEEFATRRASSVLSALARRMPNVAHRIVDGKTQDIPAGDIHVGDQLLILPYEICPVDGTVKSGMGRMDESFLTGEPFRIRKIAGSTLIGIPYDRPVVGYGGKTINTLRLWAASAPDSFNFQEFGDRRLYRCIKRNPRSGIANPRALSRRFDNRWARVALSTGVFPCSVFAR